MPSVQNNIFNDHFYWKFSAPNAEEINDFVWSLNKYDGAPWETLCSVKTLQVTEDIFPLIQPSIDLLCKEVNAKLEMRMNRPWVSEYVKGDHQEVHDHNDCDLVCVYFPEYKEGFSQFYFMNRAVNLSRPLRDLMKEKNPHILDIQSGDVVFFPGHMLHGVSIHKHDIIRRSLSCNLWINRIVTNLEGLK